MLFSLLFRPCSVDALLFSCLAPLVKIPLSSGLVHNEVRKHQNLSQYVDRILKKYLKEEKKEKIAAPGEGLFFVSFYFNFINRRVCSIILNKRKGTYLFSFKYFYEQWCYMYMLATEVMVKLTCPRSTSRGIWDSLGI